MLLRGFFAVEIVHNIDTFRYCPENYWSKCTCAYVVMFLWGFIRCLYDKYT